MLLSDEAWQGNLTDDQRVALVGWAQRYLSGSFEGALLFVRSKLAEINRLPDDERATAIEGLARGD
jgi:hypothetical protein